MLPKPPPREPPLGFLLVPPYRIQGISIAGEATCITIPELNLGFDMGRCPRAVLSSEHVAISHGHMDHIGALAYFCSQRRFQGMGTANIICDARIEDDMRTMLDGFHRLERQETPVNLIPLKDGDTFNIKNNLMLRAFHTEHTCPSMGYAVIERRTKLKPEFVGYPQEKLKELKLRGTEITRTLEIPLIAYLGDTAPGPHLVNEDVRKANIIITECTFFEEAHKQRATVGKHLHIDDIAEWLPVTECELMILTHISRRTHLGLAKNRLTEVLGDQAGRVALLMDHRANRQRYEAQVQHAHDTQQATNA